MSKTPDVFLARRPSEVATVAPLGRSVPVIYGTDRVPAIVTSYTAHGDKMLMVCIWCVGEIDGINGLTANDKALPSDYVVRHYLGTTDQQPDPVLSSAVGGYSDRMVASYAGGSVALAYSVIEVPSTEKSIPTFTATIRGKKVFDPRISQTVFTDNPALCLADYIQSQVYGQGWICANITEAANTNDELVNGKHRRSIGLSVNTERDDTPEKVVEVLRAYSGCFVAADGLRRKLIPDRPASTVGTITADNVRPGSFKRTINHESQVTVSNVTFRDTSGIPWRDGVATSYADGALDGLVPWVEESADMAGITDADMASREAQERRLSSELSTSIEFQTHDQALKYQQGDLLSVNAYGVDDVFRIMIVDPTEPGRYKIKADQYSADAYPDESVGVEVTLPPITPLFDSMDEPNMGGVTSGGGVYVEGADGTVFNRIRVDLSPPSSANFSHFEIRFRVSGSNAAWQSGQVVGTTAYLFPVQDGVQYEFESRSIGLNGAESDWNSSTHTVEKKNVPPPSPSGLSVTVSPSGMRKVTFNYGTVPGDFAGFRIQYDAGSGYVDLLEGLTQQRVIETEQMPAGDVTIRVHAQDRSGNTSGWIYDTSNIAQDPDGLWYDVDARIEAEKLRNDTQDVTISYHGTIQIPAAQARADEAYNRADAAQLTADQSLIDAATAQTEADNAAAAVIVAQAAADAAQANVDATELQIAEAEAAVIAAQSDADAAQLAASAAQTAADTAQGAATTAIANAATAQTTADNAQGSADTANANAATAQAAAVAAQTDADTANVAVIIAQSTADTANTAAAAAQTAADSAQSTADTANTLATTANTAAGAAQTTADTASSAAGTAQTAADDAAFAAGTAQTTATNATAIANTAQTAATNAENIAGVAQTAATNAENIATTANTAASNAQATADNAETIANTASTAATNATNIATNAENISNTASTAATNANNIANNAESVANAISATATNAENIANTASTAATNAENIATNANTAAGAAQTAADAAQTSATNAENIATNAENIANTASTAATNANNIANNAESIANTANTLAGVANTAASNAQTTADNAQDIGENAEDIAVLARDVANLKNRTYYGYSYPSDTQDGNVFFHQGQGYKPYRANGSSWVAVQDSGISAAQSTADSAIAYASSAQNTANTANSTANNAQSTANSAYNEAFNGIIPGSRISVSTLSAITSNLGTINAGRMNFADGGYIDLDSTGTLIVSGNTKFLVQSNGDLRCNRIDSRENLYVDGTAQIDGRLYADNGARIRFNTLDVYDGANFYGNIVFNSGANLAVSSGAQFNALTHLKGFTQVRDGGELNIAGNGTMTMTSSSVLVDGQSLSNYIRSIVNSM